MANPRFNDIEGTLNEEKAPRFDDIEEAKSSGLGERAQQLLQGVKGMFVPTKEEYSPVELKQPQRGQFPNDRAFLEAQQLQTQNQLRLPEERMRAAMMNHDERGLAAFHGADITGLGAKLADTFRPGAQRAFDQAAEVNPKTSLLGGLPIGLGETAGKLAVGAGAVGALNAKAHGQDPLAGGLSNAALALLFHGGFKLGGKALGALAGREGQLEPKTVAESPADVQARAAAANNARGGQPGALPDPQTIVNAPNLSDVWNPEMNTKVGPGATTRVSVLPEPLTVTEPPTTRSLLAGRRSPSDLEPLTVGMKKASDMMGSGPLPDEPNTAGKLASVRELLAERPTTVDDPREAEFFRDSGYWEAADAASHGDLGPLRQWHAENPQFEKGAGTALAPTAREYRLKQAPEARTGSMPTESGRDGIGTRSLRVRPTEPPAPPPTSVDSALAWLNGEDTGGGKTLTKYIPRDTLYPSGLKDPEVTHIPARNVQPLLAGGSGEPLRPAAAQQSGPPVSQPLQPQDLDEMFGALAAQSKKLLDQDAGFKAKFLRQFSLPEFRGNEILGQAVRSVNASRAIGDFQMQRLYPALQASLAKLSSADREAAGKVIASLRDKKGTLADVQKLPQQFRELFTQTMNEQQGQLVELAKGGYFGPAELQTITQNMRKGLLHLHRSYQAFYARKTFKAPEDAITSASRYIAKEAGIAPDQAAARVRAILKTASEGEGFKNVQQLLGAFRDSGLLKRRMLPAELQPLLGVVNDPSFIVSETAAQMSSMHHLMLRTRALVTPDLQGQVWSPKWVPGFDERPLWNDAMGTAENKRLFGELAGKFVPPSLRQAMIDAPTPLVENFARDLAKKVTGWFSTSKVLTSPVTWARNLLSNGLYLTASGVPVGEQLFLFKKAFSAILEGQKRLSASPAAGGEWLQMALEDGAVRPGRGTDLGGNEARQIAESVLKAPEEGLAGAWDSAHRLMQKGQLKLGKAYELFDSAARLAAYMHHVEMGKTVLNLSDQQARSHASHIVNRYFATGAGAAPIFRELSRSSLGLAPFIGWHVDNLRVAKNIIADAVKGDLGPLMRTAGWSAAPYIAGQLLRWQQGITDGDVAAGERSLKGSWRDRQGFYDWLPVRGSDGRLTHAVSFDGLNPMALFARGSPQMSIPQRVAASIMQGMVQSGAMEPWVNDQLASWGVTPEQYHPPILPGQEGWKAASSAAQFMEPALMRQFRTVARKAQLDLGPLTQPLSPTEESQGLGEALLTTFSPLSIEKVGARTQRGAQKQLRGERAGLLDDRKQVRKLQSPSERQDVLGAIKERMDNLRSRMAK